MHIISDRIYTEQSAREKVSSLREKYTENKGIEIIPACRSKCGKKWFIHVTLPIGTETALLLQIKRDIQ